MTNKKHGKAEKKIKQQKFSQTDSAKSVTSQEKSTKQSSSFSIQPKS